MQNAAAAAAVSVVPTIAVPASLLGNGVRSIVICDVVLRFVVPSLTLQLTVRRGWAPLVESVPVSW